MCNFTIFFYLDFILFSFSLSLFTIHVSDFEWFQVYLLFSLLPLIFHDHAWSTIAYLRYLNVTDNEGWLEIDQEKLRSRTSSITWATTSLMLALIIPLGHFLLNNDSKTNIEHPNYVPIAVVFLLILTLVPYLTAFSFYFRIFRYARRVMASENTMIDDTVAPPRIRHNRDRQMIRCRDSGEPEEPMAAVNVIVDDSSDDDLIEIGESQCIKQVHRVMSFKRRITILNTQGKINVFTNQSLPNSIDLRKRVLI